MAELFALGFLENMRVFFVAILIYVLIFSLLKTMNIAGNDPKINSLIALIATIIVSLSGVVTYVVSYAINWFFIIFFMLFLFFMLIMFLGVKPDQIAGAASKNTKGIIIIFIILFSIIFIKGFFALNNTFDTTNNNNNSYEIDTSSNFGVEEMNIDEEKYSFWQKIHIDPDLLSATLFLAGLGIFIYIIGR